MPPLPGAGERRARSGVRSVTVPDAEREGGAGVPRRESVGEVRSGVPGDKGEGSIRARAAPGPPMRRAVSFCATNYETKETLGASLASIERIGELAGVPFEIVVADGPSGAEVRSELLAWKEADPMGHQLTLHERRNRGYGRRLAFEQSSGEYIVPFDTSIVYTPEIYGPLLRAYVTLRTKRMLFSEVCVFERSTIEAVGGWRDLIGGEDVDVQAPVARRFGMIAYPTGDPGSQSASLRALERQSRYAGRRGLPRLWRLFLTQRDQIVGANYRVRDLLDFNRTKPPLVRVAARAWFTAAKTAAGLRGLKPRENGSNNYLYVREETIRSMRDGDRLELGWSEGPPVRLALTQDERSYLSLHSTLYRTVAEEHPELFLDKAG